VRFKTELAASLRRHLQADKWINGLMDGWIDGVGRNGTLARLSRYSLCTQTMLSYMLKFKTRLATSLRPPSAVLLRKTGRQLQAKRVGRRRSDGPTPQLDCHYFGLRSRVSTSGTPIGPTGR
jgi:hypothetical protein